MSTRTLSEVTGSGAPTAHEFAKGLDEDPVVDGLLKPGGIPELRPDLWELPTREEHHRDPKPQEGASHLQAQTVSKFHIQKGGIRGVLIQPPLGRGTGREGSGD